MGGIKNVDIVVEHFSNIRCVHCANFSNEYKKIWSENSEINNRVRIYFHPLSMIDDEDSYSAMFSAGLQGMDNFWKMEEFAFGNIGLGVTYQDLYDFASQSLQIDMTEFEKHTTLETSEGKAIYNYIYRERDEAITNCINYTPAIFVCGNPIEKWSDLEDTLMSYLNESR
jgi:protein-disulfide isomerase